MPDEDRDLMLRARSGSREAFDELVARWQGRLLGFFFRQGGDRELAEDCSQEVLVRLYKARDRYTPDARFATFLFTIARNHWIDVARARHVRPDLRATSGANDDDGEDRLSRLAAPEPTPIAHAAQMDEVARLRSAISRLPEPLREVVELGVIEGMPYAEVSSVLSIPVGTVKSRVHAAVHALRTLLAAPSAPGRQSGEGAP
jgi:RNA polymerase sigma-70 factor (ECF subfamily)